MCGRKIVPGIVDPPKPGWDVLFFRFDQADWALAFATLFAIIARTLVATGVIAVSPVTKLEMSCMGTSMPMPPGPDTSCKNTAPTP